jgi:hypothetical protein
MILRVAVEPVRHASLAMRGQHVRHGVDLGYHVARLERLLGRLPRRLVHGGLLARRRLLARLEEAVADVAAALARQLGRAAVDLWFAGAEVVAALAVPVVHQLLLSAHLLLPVRGGARPAAVARGVAAGLAHLARLTVIVLTVGIRSDACAAVWSGCQLESCRRRLDAARRRCCCWHRRVRRLRR